MEVRKANQVLTIDDSQKAAYLEKGFDVIDEKGKIIEHNTREVTPAEYAKVVAENKKLKAEIEKLKAKKA